MNQVNRTVHHGIRIYSKALLSIYDLLVMRVLTPFIWRCPAANYRDLYSRYMSPNHADIGVGTAYVLNQSRYQPGQVRIGLFDLQPNCLRYAARRLARYQPEIYQRNVLEAINIEAKGFDSVAMGGLLHCLPGDITQKAAAFDSIKSILNKNACLFGYTILNQEIEKTWLSRCVYFILQKLKVINGVEDSPSQLKHELDKRFVHCNVRILGCVALFRAYKK